MNYTPAGRKDNIVIQKISDELLVYDLALNKAYCLNLTSSSIWQLCDGEHSVPQIANKLSKKFKKTVSEEFVWLALGQLNNNQLLENGQVLTNKFGHLSRREIIRRVGFASVIALPTISSIVAPEITMAQSVCSPLLDSCVANGDCCSGACTSVRGNPTCCFGPFNTTAPGSDFENNVRCPSGPPCSPSACTPAAELFCCSGTATANNCTPFGDGTMQVCECICS